MFIDPVCVCHAPHFTMEIGLLSKYFWILVFSTFCLARLPWAYSSCLEDQKNLLLEFKKEFVRDPLRSVITVWWNRTDDCCTWLHVECNDEGRVIGLQLEDEVISGTFNSSSALFRLSHLKKLNLAHNSFRGSEIPSAIHNLTGLTHLNLSNSYFSGQVPLGLSSLTSLVSLDLSADRFSNSMSLTIENPNLKTILQNLTRLRALHLDHVNINAVGGDWGCIISSSLPDLQSLSLRECGLSGPVHSSLAQLDSLSVLQLDANYLRSTLLDFIAKFSNLTTLTLSSCGLIGSFPDKIFQMPTLEYLDISANRNISGTLPQFPYGGSLRTIDLSFTNFSGALPNSISNLKMLTKINMFGCNFEGTIPLVLTDLLQLTYLDLSVNSFSGPIPSFYSWKNLSYINLSDNKLTGSLSSIDFEGNSDLAYLNLRNNLLNGSIPQALFSNPSLQYLLLSGNNFSGFIREFSSLLSSNLYMIDLSINKLEGPVPESFFKLQGLRYLILSNNSFNGTINFGQFRTPLLSLHLSYNNLSIDASHINSSMPTFSQLGSLGLSSCNLHSIPDLRNQSALTFLDLSNNKMTGEVPNWIWEIGNGRLMHLNLSSNLLVDIQRPYNISPDLVSLDLHSNQLRGRLPSIPLTVKYMDFSYNDFEGFLVHTMGNFSLDCAFLSLANNRLRGTIPLSLCDAGNLLMLDLSNNELTGNIPSCIVKDLEILRVLNLARNNISGNIPDAFSGNCSLQSMELGNNKLGGKVPPSLANCKSLEVMNIGDNQIEDTFPCMVPTSLRVLVLRSNKFYRDVNCHKSWPNLQIMDIAYNNFSGNLYPLNFSSWRGMQRDNDSPQLLPNNLHVEIWVNLNYLNTVTLTFKGNEFVLTRILTIFTSIDISSNNFHGEIPNAVGDLKSIYALNLSHNALTGTVPNSFRNLIQLGSLDLSMNMLTGEIPRELAGLTFLSVLNLSYNKLVGAIPQGPQFQTFSASSFQGNKGLCGLPLDERCTTDTDENGAGGQHEEHSYKREEIKWEYVLAASGFGVGFGSIVWVLFGCERVRPIFCEKAEQIFEYICVTQQNRRKGQRRRVQRNQVGRQ